MRKRIGLPHTGKNSLRWKELRCDESYGTPRRRTLLKNEEIPNVLDTQKFLNRPVEVAVSNTSGAAGIAHWIDSHYRLKGDQKVDKNSELVKMIKSWVDQQYRCCRERTMRGL